MSNYVIFNP